MIRSTPAWTARATLLLVLTALLGIAAIPASADNIFFVNSTKDKVDANIGNGICADAKGRCTLRAAIQEANFDADYDTIKLPTGTFTLKRAGIDEDGAATGDLDITAEVDILGAYPGKTVIDGGGLDRIFDVRDGAGVILQDVIMTNGHTGGEGGCISVDALGTLGLFYVKMTACSANAGGALRLVDGASTNVLFSTFSGNTATVSGGAIYAHAADSVVILESLFKGNSAQEYGGAIHAAGSGTLATVNSTFRSNSTTGKYYGDGGAIMADGVIAELISTRFLNNSSTFYGGAVDISSGTGSTIFDSDFQGNTAGDSGGGLYLYNTSAPFVISESSFTGNTVTGGYNFGGGILIDRSQAELVNSTISGNRAQNGAGVYLYDLTIERAARRGSSLRAVPTLALDFVTITRNKAGDSGGGIYSMDGEVTMSRSIVSDNKAALGLDCFASLINASESLVSDTAQCGLAGAGNLENVSAALGALTYLDPGITPVHVPSAGSPALAAALDCSDITTDQRLVTRPAANCDIGSVQVDLRDLLVNGNFEDGVNGWKFVTNTGSKVAAKAAFTGQQGILIKGGAGAATKLKQSLPVDSLVDGDWISFGGYLSINDDVPVNATASIILKYSDGTNDKASSPLESNGGLYCGCSVFGELPVNLSGRTVTKLVVKVKDKTVAKKYFIDYLYVTVTSGILRGESRMEGRGVLPPPAAPDGFRGGN